MARVRPRLASPHFMLLATRAQLPSAGKAGSRTWPSAAAWAGRCGCAAVGRVQRARARTSGWRIRRRCATVVCCNADALTAAVLSRASSPPPAFWRATRGRAPAALPPRCAQLRLRVERLCRRLEGDRRRRRCQQSPCWRRWRRLRAARCARMLRSSVAPSARECASGACATTVSPLGVEPKRQTLFGWQLHAAAAHDCAQCGAAHAAA